SFLVGIAISDGNRTALAYTSVAVGDAPVSLGGTAPATVAANDSLDSIELATFAGLDAQDSAADYQALVYWGDGSADWGQVVGTGGHFYVVGSHTNRNDLPADEQTVDHLRLTVVLLEPGGTWATRTQDLSVTPWREGTPGSNPTWLHFRDSNPYAH